MPDDKKKNKGGRPRAVEPGVRVSTYVPVSEYQRLFDAAKRDDKSISGTVRDLLRKTITGF